ncbi:hypothetical protein F2Q69_00023662 [Brassica cretica]|uniref:Uncharacterized protein n=1 Tax=Brassica cretica TaxID=69181 RepID=A0A8S9QKN9_BRACR|nr:hypothetical protein F2Q69_00023662 [Brassica cretica]
MTHPHEEMMAMEELKNRYDMLGFIADAHGFSPWVFGVEEEVRSLRREVDDMAAEISKLKRLITRP